MSQMVTSIAYSASDSGTHGNYYAKLMENE